MTYKETLAYLDSFIDYEKSPFFDYKESLKLDRMRNLARCLGDPQQDLRSIHIAGTKGKGSTSAMVASILKEAGFRVGLYTSPHLVSFRERIKISDEMIKKEELCSLAEKIKPVISKIGKGSDLYPTFFEVYTAIAFLYFKEKKTDFCVLEVGMGGRLDATNIIERPFASGITQISYDHTQKLGNTLAEIASEKAGIIKENCICVSSGQEPAAAEVIRKACADKKCRLYEVGRDIHFREERFDGSSSRQQAFSVSGISGKYPFLKIGLLGDHQLMNAATAIGLVESLRFYDIIVSYNSIRDGLKKVNWPGRLQVLKEAPLVVLDGAQNRASAAALSKAVKRFFKYDRLILVLGISKDKDIKGVCEELQDISSEIILTRADIPRAAEPGIIKNYFNKPARLTGRVEEALGLAQEMAGPTDLILITGSFFVLGEAVAKAKMPELNYA